MATYLFLPAQPAGIRGYGVAGNTSVFQTGVAGSYPVIHFYGIIAQMGERLLCKQKVGSSNLPGSILCFRSPTGRAADL